MSEYVVNPDEWLMLTKDEINDENFDRIVRCRDCEYYDKTPWLKWNDEVTKPNCWYFQDYEGTPMPVKPDGFCAWGESKVSE